MSSPSDLIHKPEVVDLTHAQSDHANKYATYPGDRCVRIRDRRIANWTESVESTDGLHLTGNGFAYVSNSVISREGNDPTIMDELASVVNGGEVTFYRCRFKDNGKAFLQGSGDTNVVDLLKGQRVLFRECIFENCGRRNPFVQVGQGYLINCLVKNWGKCFHEKSFGVRAGSDGQVMVVRTIFMQESFWSCLTKRPFFKDVFNQYIWPLPLIPGFIRGAYADTKGHVRCVDCYKNRWWIHLDNATGTKNNTDEMFILEEQLELNVPDI